MTPSAAENNEDKHVEKEAAEIQSTIKETERFVSVFLLNNLRVVLNEQVKAKLLNSEVADYIYEAIKDQAVKKGWID